MDLKFVQWEEGVTLNLLLLWFESDYVQNIGL